MELHKVEENPQYISLAVKGDIRQEDVWVHDPIEMLLGGKAFQRTVLLGLQEALSIDSSGIGWLLLANRRFNDKGGRLIVHSVPNMVSQMLEFLHVDRKLEIADDYESAQRSAVRS
jgi:anti-anti-sigma factor